MNRRRYTVSVASNWVQMAWAIVWGIVMVPIYLKYLGKAEYGIWILIHAVVGYYGLLDLGVYKAVVRHVSRYIGLEDSGQLNEVFNTALVVQGLTGLIALGICIVVALTLPHLGIFEITQHRDARMLLLLVGASTALNFPGSVFRGALVAAGRFDLSNLIRMLSSLAINVGQILVLSHDGGLVELAWVLLAVTLLEKPVAVLLALGYVPHLRLAPRMFCRRRVREVLVYGFHAFATSAGERLRFFTDSVVIGGFLPAQAITDFRMGSRPLQFLTNGVRGISSVLTPAFSRTEAVDSPDHAARLLVLGTRATAVIGTLGCLILTLAGARLLRLWLGEGFESSATILLVLMPAYLLETTLAPTGSLLLGTDDVRVISRATIAEGLANLGLSLVLIQPFGLIGVAVGTVLPMIVVRLFVLPWFACRKTGLPYPGFLAEVWRPVLPPVVGAGLLGIALRSALPGSDLLPVSALVGAVTACYVALTVLGMRRRDDELLPARFRR